MPEALEGRLACWLFGLLTAGWPLSGTSCLSLSVAQKSHFPLNDETSSFREGGDGNSFSARLFAVSLAGADLVLIRSNR